MKESYSRKIHEPIQQNEHSMHYGCTSTTQNALSQLIKIENQTLPITLISKRLLLFRQRYLLRPLARDKNRTALLQMFLNPQKINLFILLNLNLLASVVF